MKWLGLLIVPEFMAGVMLFTFSMCLLALACSGCATEHTRGPLPVQCTDQHGLLFEGTADGLLHLVPEGYWEFFDYQTHSLVRVHGDCRFVGR